MSPHLEEAWRALRLADRDIRAFQVLKRDSDSHVSVVCFHAQQAVEKSLKAVLFSRRIEFTRTHNLTDLALLLSREGVDGPVSESQLFRLTPFAVTYRYDDFEVDLIGPGEAAEIVAAVREWAERWVRAAEEAEGGREGDA